MSCVRAGFVETLATSQRYLVIIKGIQSRVVLCRYGRSQGLSLSWSRVGIDEGADLQHLDLCLLWSGKCLLCSSLMKQKNWGLLHSFSTLGLASFLGLFVCLLILAGLGWLCQEVWEREAFSFDKAFMMWVHQWSRPLLDKFMIGATRLGDPEIVVSVILVNLGWFLARGRRYAALMLIVACVGALALNVGLKLVFARPRPVLWPHLINETSYGFPSGHALGSLVLYGFLAYVFACWYPRQSGWIYGIATGTVALIGFSRIYLGVHFPTDILAGYSVGILWLVFCINIPKLSGARLAGEKGRGNR